jgi:hypothetical protein
MVNTRVVAAVTVLAALLSLLSMLVVPWAWYGDIDLRMHRLPNWTAHVGSVAVLYAAVAWTALAPVARRAVPLTVTACASAVAVATTAVVARGYDNASALFQDVAPMVAPSLGPGPFLAVLAVLAGLDAAVVATRTPGIS